MECPDCGSNTVTFAVPEDLREHAPEENDFAALCASCLRVHRADDGEKSPDFDAVGEFFPDEHGGVALALLLGKLDSLALNRSAIEDLSEQAEGYGADVLLTLDRLDTAGSVQPYFDLDRRRAQVSQLLGQHR